jgi:predicted component of type VI protein secretion system
MNHSLFVVSGADAGRRFMLSEGQSLLIGRGQQSNAQINDPRMSRVHCEVTCEQGKVFLRDQGSASGILVDGAGVVQCLLRSGSIIQLGDTLIRYSFDGSEDASTLVGGNRAFGKPKPPPDIAPLADLAGTMLGRYQLLIAPLGVQDSWAGAFPTRHRART